MKIRQATYKDLDALMQLFEGAKQIMRSCGNVHQWNAGYPSVDIVNKDIESGYCYVVCEEDKILATMALIPGPDPTYTYIEGRWSNEYPYYVIHRIATALPGQNLASKMLDWAFEHIWSKGLNSIRIDTHRDNCIMKHILTKYGFEECGVIYLANGDPRDAYIMKKGTKIHINKI